MPRVTITVPDHTSQPYRFQLDRKLVTIGRGSENDIAIECGSVSNKHAEMARIDGGYVVRDLGSTNGVKVGGMRAEVVPLQSDMTVHLGDVAFHFLLNDEELELLRREQEQLNVPVIRENPLPPLPPSKEVTTERKAPGPRQPQVVQSTGNRGTYVMIALFVVLAAIAFFIGLSIRHKRETGSSLMNAIRTTQPSAPVPAAK
jgi:pSer/pThr/pTyr-binding forkhead associated (FHA) protein